MGRKALAPIITIGLILATSACGSPSKNLSQVTGRVIDSRTQKPVAEASVGYGKIQTRTDAAGRFVLRNVPKVATLTASASNYRSAAEPVSAQPETVAIEPVPVTGVVIGDLARGPLTSALLEHTTTRAKVNRLGRFALYGVGPGDEVKASAPGYAPQTVKVPATRSLAYLLKATAASWRAYDLPLIQALWRNNSDAWGTGGPEGYASSSAFVNARNYRGIAGDLAACPHNTPAGYDEEYVLSPSTVARDDGWVMTFGSLKGQVPKGRIYIMQVTTSYSDGSPEQLDEVHVSIVDDKALQFDVCAS